MEKGRAVAALVMLENTDLETVALSTDPEFLRLIEDSRAGHAQEGGLSGEEVRKQVEGEDASRRRRPRRRR